MIWTDAHTHNCGRNLLLEGSGLAEGLCCACYGYGVYACSPGHPWTAEGHRSWQRSLFGKFVVACRTPISRVRSYSLWQAVLDGAATCRNIA